MAVQIQTRRDTSTNWTSNNPTLAQGEIGFETNTNKFKFGDGSTVWTSLPYGTSTVDQASEISIGDAGGYYTGTDVEAALQEIGVGTTLDSRYLKLAGGTLTGNLLFTDNTLDIGASGATRPRTGYFGTSLVTPTIIGGTGTTSDLNLKTTSGVGATGADMHFLVGNNGATEAMTILNSGDRKSVV